VASREGALTQASSAGRGRRTAERALRGRETQDEGRAPSGSRQGTSTESLPHLASVHLPRAARPLPRPALLLLGALLSPGASAQSLPSTYPACIYNASQRPEAGSRRFDRVIKRSTATPLGPDDAWITDPSQRSQSCYFNLSATCTVYSVGKHSGAQTQHTGGPMLLNVPPPVAPAFAVGHSHCAWLWYPWGLTLALCWLWYPGAWH